MTIAGTWEPLQRIAELDATVEAQARELEKLRALLRACDEELTCADHRHYCEFCHHVVPNDSLRQQIRAALGGVTQESDPEAPGAGR